MPAVSSASTPEEIPEQRSGRRPGRRRAPAGAPPRPPAAETTDAPGSAAPSAGTVTPVVTRGSDEQAAGTPASESPAVAPTGADSAGAGRPAPAGDPAGDTDPTPAAPPHPTATTTEATDTATPRTEATRAGALGADETEADDTDADPDRTEMVGTDDTLVDPSPADDAEADVVTADADPADTDPADASRTDETRTDTAQAGEAETDADPADETRTDAAQAGGAETDAAPADRAEAARTDEAEAEVDRPDETKAGVAGAGAVETRPPVVEAPSSVGRLAEALTGLRSAIGGTAYPLVMPSADEAARTGRALVTQLDDYLLPRLARLDAPLLVVVGGSTGAGKSTLVNSLVRAPVSSAGVLRPTTRSPVLVCHPSDSPWFRKGDLLPGMTRTTEPSNDPHALQLVAAPALGAGLAFLDAPDIDSVVDANRALAAQLLAAADLWLFVTTAARYADAVPWELLRTARLRGTVTALVLDRVPMEAAGEISAHLAEMLAAHDMAAAPLFVLPETRLDGQGLVPEEIIRPLHDWFAQLAADAGARSAVVRQTLDGALSAVRPAVEQLAAAADEQVLAARALDERVRAAYRNGRRTVEQGLVDGRLLRGEVLARWQEFIGTGEFLRSLESRVGRLRDRVVAAVTGRPAPGSNLQVALESQLVTLLRGVAADAAEQAYTGWQAHPAGAALLDPALGRPSDDLPERAERAIRDWQRHVLELVRAEAGDRRFVARSAAYAINATGLAVMIAVFTSTAFIPTGAEVAVGAGTTVAAQKVLEAIFGDQAIRALAARAREDLLTRVDELFEAEAARYAARIEIAGLDVEPGGALRRAADAVERARDELALTGGPVPALSAAESDS